MNWGEQPLDEARLWKKGLKTFGTLFGITSRYINDHTSESDVEALHRIEMLEEIAESIIEVASELRRALDPEVQDFVEDMNKLIDSLPTTGVEDER